MGMTRTLNGNARTSARQLTKDIGHPGLDQSYGRIQDDFLREWNTTREKVKNVERMLKNNPLIGGSLRLAMEMSIRGVNWYYTSDNGEEDPDLQLVRDAAQNMTHSWQEHVTQALLMPFFGWDMHTITYQKVGNLWYWRKFKQLAQKSLQNWIFAPDGGLLGIQQYANLWPDPIPIERMIIYRFRSTYGNPEGESILRPMYIPHYYATNLQEVQAIGYERNANGLPWIKMPRGADPSESGEDFKTASKLGRNIRIDEQGAIITPPALGELPVDEWRVELLSTNNATVFNAMDNTIMNYKKEMLMAGLAQFIVIGMGSVGTQALAESDISFFTMAVNSIADIITETHNKYAIPRLLKLNGRQPGAVKLEHSPAGDLDEQMISNLLQVALPNNALTWTPEDEVFIRSVFRMPEKTPEEIADAREEADQRRATIAAQFRPRNNQNSDDEDDDMTPDENTAVFFAADNAPDDDDRRRFERTWERKWRQWFKAQNGRVIQGVKNA